MITIERETLERLFRWIGKSNEIIETDLFNELCAALAQPAPAAAPLTDEQMLASLRSSGFRGNGGQIDWFCEGLRAAEKHHGISAGGAA
jgi:hypothetical protein